MYWKYLFYLVIEKNNIEIIHLLSNNIKIDFNKENEIKTEQMNTMKI
mgnify:FL=1